MMGFEFKLSWLIKNLNIYHFIIFLLISSNLQLVKCNFCKKEKIDHTEKLCPNPDQFDILTEYEKHDDEWKLDFDHFRKEGFSHAGQLLKELLNRARKGAFCPYIKKVSTETCCDGWEGADCKKASCNPACMNGGLCVEPNKCECPVGYAGEYCQAQENSKEIGHCYVGHDCSMDHKMDNRFYSYSYCCEKKNGTSWGTECKACPMKGSDMFGHVVQTHRLPFSTCLLWGKDHFRTFDGTFFEYDGACEYKLAGSASWQINFIPENCKSWTTCSKKIKMTFGGVQVVAQGSNITIDNKELHLEEGFVKEAITVERRGDFINLKYSDGVRVKWHSDGITVYLTVDEQYSGKVSGLCGHYNHNYEDDFMLPDGTVTSQATTFANLWRVDSSCPEVAPERHPCLNEEDFEKAKKACAALDDPNDSFKTCRKIVNATHFVEYCEWDYCSALSSPHPEIDTEIALCHAYEAMAQECADFYVNVDWRKASRCPKICPNGKVYSECASTCPKTCQNRHQNFGSLECKQECSPGCVCPDGYYLDNGKGGMCVTADECTCYYRGQYYPTGSNVSVECNECFCKGGKWECTENKCPRTCSVIGTGHYRTFDGKSYSMKGHCEYTLLEQTDPNAYPRLLVSHRNDHGQLKDGPTELSVKVMDTTVTIKTDGVFINSASISELPYKNLDLVVRKVTTIFYSIEGKGFKILFDGIRIYVKVEPFFANNVRGLCGTFNYKSTDDFSLPNGIVESEINEFVNAYRLSDSCNTPLQIEPCESNVAAEPEATKLCNVLRNEIFKPCEAAVDPAVYIETCKFDLCSDTSQSKQDLYRCRAIAAYAQECAQKGIIVDWLSVSEIRSSCENSNYAKCPGGSAYNECAKTCNTTCKDLAYEHGKCNSNDCIAGCVCPEDQHFDMIDGSLQCVPRKECTCFDVYSQKAYLPKDSIKRSCSNCTCEEGVWNCQIPNCNAGFKCPGNQVFSKNSSVCPKTCDNKDHYRNCYLVAEGCSCPDGKVLDFNLTNCVEETECPCKYSGKIYKTNEKIVKGCEVCSCTGGHWNCSTSKCDGVCVAAGDPHYTTFDGRRFSYQGNCKYILSQTTNQKFRVIAENIPCGTSGVTCTKNLMINYDDLQINLMRGKNIEVNGLELKNLNEGSKVFGDVNIMKAGMYHVVNSTNFLIKWDGATRVYITIHSQWKGLMQGVCGNFDSDSTNDLQTLGGILGSVEDLFESWKVDQYCSSHPSPIIDESDPCHGHLHRKEWATKECSMINTPSEDNPFKPCIEKMDITDIQKSHVECLFDACSCDRGGDCECLCTSLASFAELCNKIGVPIKWRSQERCPIQCEYGKQYQACGSLCQPSCKDISLGINRQCENDGCVEGCFCPNGMVTDYDDKCVYPEECECYYDNKLYENGTVIERDCKICQCINGKFDCYANSTNCKPPCNPETEFTCISDQSCIAKAWLCDKIVDCEDGSDELNCECKATDFVCGNGQCVNSTYVCDGLPNCRDGSDEIGCMTQPPCGEFQCASGKCIPYVWLCDGYMDCGGVDDSDERNCTTTPECLDEVREFHCQDTGSCLPIAEKCDGHDDCGDGSDEDGCTCICEHAFTCKNVCHCVDPKTVCDGFINCPDGSDEFNCTCSTNEYKCRSGPCLNTTLLCNGVKNCPMGDDETHPSCTSTTTTPITVTSTSTTTETTTTTTTRTTSTSTTASTFTTTVPISSSTTSGPITHTTTPITITTTTPIVCDTLVCNVLGATVCIPPVEICDGVMICENGADEIPDFFPNNPKCQKTTTTTQRSSTTTEYCIPNFKCSENLTICLDESEKCDHICQCTDTCLDEANCYSTTAPPCSGFMCDMNLNSIRKCLNNSAICDGVQDCFDNSDEDYNLCHNITTTSTMHTTTTGIICHAENIQNITNLMHPLINSESSEGLVGDLSDFFDSENIVTVKANTEANIQFEFFTSVNVLRVMFNSKHPIESISMVLDNNVEMKITKTNLIDSVLVIGELDQHEHFEYAASNLVITISSGIYDVVLSNLILEVCSDYNYNGFTGVSNTTAEYTVPTRSTTTRITTTTEEYICNQDLGMTNGDIMNGNIVVSSQKDETASINNVRLGQPIPWIAANDDSNPSVTIHFTEKTDVTGFKIRGQVDTIQVLIKTNDNSEYEKLFDTPVRRSASELQSLSIIRVPRQYNVTEIIFLFSNSFVGISLSAQLEILGCKEATTTRESTSITTSPTYTTTTTTEICTQIEMIGNGEFITGIHSKDFVFPPDMLQGQGGISLSEVPAEFQLILTNTFILKNIQIKMPNTQSNVNNLEIILISSSTNITVYTRRTQTVYIPNQIEVNSIIIKIKDTLDNDQPTNIELSIKACIEPTPTSTVTTTTPVTTTSPVTYTPTETVTTSTVTTTTPRTTTSPVTYTPTETVTTSTVTTTTPVTYTPTETVTTSTPPTTTSPLTYTPTETVTTSTVTTTTPVTYTPTETVTTSTVTTTTPVTYTPTETVTTSTPPTTTSPLTYTPTETVTTSTVTTTTPVTYTPTETVTTSTVTTTTPVTYTPTETVTTSTPPTTTSPLTYTPTETVTTSTVTTTTPRTTTSPLTYTPTETVTTSTVTTTTPVTYTPTETVTTSTVTTTTPVTYTPTETVTTSTVTTTTPVTYTPTETVTTSTVTTTTPVTYTPTETVTTSTVTTTTPVTYTPTETVTTSTVTTTTPVTYTPTETVTTSTVTTTTPRTTTSPVTYTPTETVTTSTVTTTTSPVTYTPTETVTTSTVTTTTPVTYTPTETVTTSTVTTTTPVTYTPTETVTTSTVTTTTPVTTTSPVTYTPTETVTTSTSTTSTTPVTVTTLHTTTPECEKIEIIGNGDYISGLKTNDFFFLAELTPGQGGVRFGSLPTEFYLIMTQPLQIHNTDIKLANQNTNVNNYQISFISTSLNFTYHAQKNQPIHITESIYVKMIKIEIIDTEDNGNATFVELSIRTCTEQITTTTSPSTVTTTTPPTTTSPVTYTPTETVTTSTVTTTTSPVTYTPTETVTTTTTPRTTTSPVTYTPTETVTTSTVTTTTPPTTTSPVTYTPTETVTTSTVTTTTPPTTTSPVTYTPTETVTTTTTPPTTTSPVTYTPTETVTTSTVTYTTPTKTVACSLLELVGNAEFITGIKSNDFIFPADLIKGQGGISLNSLPAEFELVLPNTLILENTLFSMVNANSNVGEYSVVFSNDFSNVFYNSTSMIPIFISGPLEVDSIFIKVLNTFDQKNPRNIEISLKSCVTVKNKTTTASTSTIVSTTFITTTSLTSTTTAPCHYWDGMSDVNSILSSDVLKFSGSSKSEVGDSIRNGTSGVDFSASDFLEVFFRKPTVLNRIEILDGSNLKTYNVVYGVITGMVFDLGTIDNTTVEFYDTEVTVLKITPLSKHEENVPYKLTIAVYGCFEQSFVSTTQQPTSTSTYQTTTTNPISTSTSSLITTSFTSGSTSITFTTTTGFCRYSEWSEWSPCGNNCGISFKERTRQVISGTCYGKLNETDICVNPTCECRMTKEIYKQAFGDELPIDNIFGWIEKDNVEGYTPSDLIVMLDDVVPNGAIVHAKNCSEFICEDIGLRMANKSCSRNCSWGDWNEWSQCSAPCGTNGLKYRTRQKYPAIGYGLECEGDYNETVVCYNPCDCSVSQWSEWTDCSKSCGAGEKTRYRELLYGNSLQCNVTLVETDICNTECCPIDGKYNEWSQWSTCSKTCNSGIRKRSRECNEPDCNGAPCNGPAEEVEQCNTQPCGPICENGKVFSNCSNACDLTCSTLTCNEACTKPDTCLPGCQCPPGSVENDEGLCVTTDKCFCNKDGRIILSGQSYNTECETCKCLAGCLTCSSKDCTYCELSQWTEWSTCSNPCHGTQSRYRNYYGNNCTKDEIESETRDCGNDCTCLIDNIRYEDDAIFTNPNDKCQMCKCYMGSVQCATNCTETKVSCESKTDSEYIYKWFPPVGDECCGFCNRTKRPHDNCEIKKLGKEFLIAGNCISLSKLDRETCDGTCKSFETSYINMNGYIMGEKECKCCSADETYTETIKMNCDGNVVEAEYTRIKNCKCNMCSSYGLH